MTLALFQIIRPFPLHHFLPFPLLISRVLIHLPCFRLTVSVLWFLRLPFSASVSLFLFLYFILTCLPFPHFTLSPSVFPICTLIFSPSVSPQSLCGPAPFLTHHLSNHHFLSCHHRVFFPLSTSHLAFCHIFHVAFCPSLHLFSPPIYPFFPCNFPSHPTATFLFHPSPKWVHFLIFILLRYHRFSNLFLRHDFYLPSTRMEPSWPIPICLFPSRRSSFPCFLPCQGFFSSPSLLLLPLSSSVYHPLISQHFFSHSNFVTVSTHQAVFIFLSFGHIIFLIFSSYNIPLCHYSPLLLFCFLCTLERKGIC